MKVAGQLCLKSVGPIRERSWTRSYCKFYCTHVTRHRSGGGCLLISLSPSSKSTGARERGIVYVDIWPGRAKGRKVSLASVASPAETVVLIQPLLCFAPLLHPPRLSCVGTLFSSSARKQHCWQAKTIQPLEQLSARPLQRYTQSSNHSLLFIVGPSSARRTTSLSSTTARAHDDTERRIDGCAVSLAHPRVCTLNSQNSSKGVFFTQPP
jgi:hypothetical protein